MTTSIWANARLELADPRELVLENNSRIIENLAKEDPQFCASVAANGVLTPLIANPTDAGRLLVRDGFRRTMAAIMAPETNPVVPVVVTESEDAQDWTRLQEQWVVNEHRAGYSEANKAVIYEQMTMFGFDASEIAERLGAGTTAESVRAGLAVRASGKAAAALEQHPQLSLEQAAALAEFDDDADASEELAETLATEPEQFDHTVARLQRVRADEQARAALAAELNKQGVSIVEYSWDERQQRRLGDLYASRDDRTVLGDNPEAHADCPGHAATITNYTGEGPRAGYVCTQWRAQGHVYRHGTSSGSGPKTEEEKAEARRVRPNNKDWRAAEKVRRKFLATLARRKTPPKRAQQFLAAAVLAGDSAVSKAMQEGHTYLHTLLGTEVPKLTSGRTLVGKLGKANANQATMLQLAAVLAAYEDSTGVHTWRNTTGGDRRYFAALAEWGYTLSPVERIVLDTRVLGVADADAVSGPASSGSSDSAGSAATRGRGAARKKAEPAAA